MTKKPSIESIRAQFDYDADTGLLTRKNLRAFNVPEEPGSRTKDGYLVVGIDGGHQLLHRLVWAWVHGDWPPKQIEHVNGDKSDNRLANLRLRSPSVKTALTSTRLKELLSYDLETGLFIWRNTTRATKEGERAGSIRPTGYRSVTLDLVSYYEHRLAFLYVTGKWPDKWVDHRNGDRADNRFSNLREADGSSNSHNTTKVGPNNTTGYRGVARYMDKYIAQIMYRGRRIAIGMYDAPLEASKAYEAKRIELFGSEPENASTMVYYKHGRKRRKAN